MKIKLTRNPWFVPACGVAALSLLAWFTSPFETLVIDVPWFVAIVGGLRVARALSDEPPAHQRAISTGSPKAVLVLMVGLVGLVIVLAAAAMIVWWRITDSGMVGWLDAVQARQSGKYSPRMSLLTAFFYLVDVVGVVVVLALWLTRTSRHDAVTATGAVAAGPAAPAAPVVVLHPTAPAGKHALAMVFAGLIVATWSIGFVAYEVVAMRHQAELQARYTPVELGATHRRTDVQGIQGIRARWQRRRPSGRCHHRRCLWRRREFDGAGRLDAGRRTCDWWYRLRTTVRAVVRRQGARSL